MTAKDKLKGMIEACRRDIDVVEHYYIHGWTVRELTLLTKVRRRNFKAVSKGRIKARLGRGIKRLGYIAPGTMQQIKEARKKLRKREGKK